MDIKLNNPDDPKYTDGILIPRMNKLPNTMPTANQDGMLVYLSQADGYISKGFYYWNDSSHSWQLVNMDNGDLYAANYGVIPNDGIDDLPALRNLFSIAKMTKKRIKLPAGVINLKMYAPEIWDFEGIAQDGFSLRGMGIGATTLLLESVGIPYTKALWEWHSHNGDVQIINGKMKSYDWFDVNIEDLSIRGSFGGVLFQLGRNDLADPLNVFSARQVGFFNTSSVGSPVSLRVNFMVNSHFDNCRANAFAQYINNIVSNGTADFRGTAVQLRRSLFVTHTNYSYGNAYVGIHFD